MHLLPCAAGVTHLKVESDVDGIFAILDWLSFIPSARGSPIPILPTSDPVDRPITFMPPKAPYDPRWMIAGRQKPGTCISHTTLVK